MPTLLLISGSLRKGSYNTKLAREAERLWSGPTEWAEIRFPLFDEDIETGEGIPEAVQHLADRIAAADAVAISTPEYNKSIPGGLKNALDWVSRTKGNPWNDKPVAIMSAAGGRGGGDRSQFALRLAMTPFQPRLLTGPEVMVAGASKEFDEEGRLISEQYRKTLTTLMEKLAREAAR